MGAKYETRYVVFARTGIGLVRVRVCHPEAVSLVKVPLASSVPVEVHRWPTWVPPLVALPLKNRIPVTEDAVVVRNFAPTSTALASPLSGLAGPAEAGKTVHGHCCGPTVTVTVLTGPMLTLSSSARTLIATVPRALGVQL